MRHNPGSNPQTPTRVREAGSGSWAGATFSPNTIPLFAHPSFHFLKNIFKKVRILEEDWIPLIDSIELI